MIKQPYSQLIKHVLKGFILLVSAFISLCVAAQSIYQNHQNKTLGCDTQVTKTNATSTLTLPIPIALQYHPTLSIAQYALHDGDARSANLIEGLIPLYKKPATIIFANIRYYNPNGTPVEWNADVGFRRLFDQSNRLISAYGGYDNYRSNTGNRFNQVHGGFGYWVRRYFLGGNVYIPIGTKVYDNDALNIAYLIPTSTSYRYNIGFAAGKERVLPGGDLEIGYDLTHGLTAYAGGYYFDHSGVKSIAGPKVRATYTFYHRPYHRLLGFFDRIRLEGLIAHDSVRGTSWYAGLRASVALLPNPTRGLARHMTDPLRRDLNVISSGFNQSNQLYQIDGRPARVDLVDSSRTRSINEAVSGTPDIADADIIGVRGSRSATGVLIAGARNLTVTGNAYSFAIEGHPYTIEKVGDNGHLIAATAANLWSLEGSQPLVLQYITMNTDNTQFLLRNGNQGVLAGGGGSFNLTMNSTISNAPIDLTTDNNLDVGILRFSHNQITLNQSMAINLNTQGAQAAALALINLSAGNPASSNFIMPEGMYDNNIAITLDGILSSGWYVQAYSISIGNIYKNTFTIDLSRNAGSFIGAWYFLGGPTGVGSNMRIIGDVTSNTLSINAIDPTGLADMFAWGIININVEINGNVNDNIFSASENESNNTFTHLEGLYLLDNIANSSLVVNGNMNHNTFFALSDNIFTKEYGVRIDDTVSTTLLTTVNGDMNYNKFNASGHEAKSFSVIRMPILISGNISHNTFTAWSNIDIGGHVGANIFTSGANSTPFTVYGNISHNTFTESGHGTGYNFLLGTPLIIGGNVSDNTFTASNNTSDGYGLRLGATRIDGAVTGNKMAIQNNGGVNRGFDLISSFSTSQITFKQAVRDNVITVTNTLNSYGFYLNANSGAGEINFLGNSSPDELSSSNNNASVEPSTSTPGDGINYFGLSDRGLDE